MAVLLSACSKADNTDDPENTATGTGDSITEEGEELKGITPFELGQVVLTDDYYENAFDKEIEYLLSFDTDKLLAGFRETAGLDMKDAVRYTGWEDDLIGGHSVGHYLSAIAQAYASLPEGDKDREALYNVITAMIDGLKECQDETGTGFIFGAKIVDKSNIEKQFDNVEANLTNITTQAWVPWYTMHKILAGLVDVYNYTGYEAAKTVASSLGDWVYERTSKWDKATQNKVLAIEYGGMNDCLYELYAITGKDEHAIAAHSFDEITLFENVYEDIDNTLNNRHANTTIPKFLGALKRYAILDGKTVAGETVDASIYLEYAESFWEMVVNKHTYITGGNSEWEHFGLDYVLDAERTNCNCETCNTYNMLKMTRLLFQITGDIKYADYYENTFINAIMSSQNPETGMTMYFQPMDTGYFKVYSTEFTKFWCCTGSGMENFTKLGDSLYFKNGNILYVNQYISSTVNWEGRKVSVEQVTDIPNTDTAAFTIRSEEGEADIDLYFRLPDWLAGSAAITVGGAAYTAAEKGGFAVVEGPFADGTVVEITLPMEVRAYNLADNKNVYAFKYGPVVLSALLGTESMTQGVTGVEVTIPQTKLVSTDYVPSGSDTVNILNGSTVEEFMENINDNLVKTEGKVEFTLTNTDANLTFVTHYSQHTERYGIYWEFAESGSDVNVVQYMNDKRADRLAANLLDTVQPGYGQYENDELHQMAETGSGSTGSTESGTSRYANENGGFTYRMLVDDSAATSLLATFAKADNGKTISISVGGKEIYSAALNYTGTDAEYQVEIPIPADIISANAEQVNANGVSGKAVTFEFTGIDNAQSARLCTFLYTIRSFGKNTSLTVTTEEGSVSADGDTVTVNLKEDAAEAVVSLEIGDKHGYVTINGSVVDESKPKTLSLNGKYTDFTVVVYAEDHSTSKQYTLTVVTPGEGIRANVDESVAYFVDCGDHGPTTVSSGDLFGTHNSVTEQLYGKDPLTGYTWGLIDDPTDTYNGSPISAGLYTSNTWCYEQNSCEDGLPKEGTHRYTKNQYENGKDRTLEYAFQLEDGQYMVEIGFANPWNCSNHPSAYANLGKDNQSTIVESLDLGTKTTCSAVVTVSGGELTISFRSEDLAINVTYIKISPAT